MFKPKYDQALLILFVIIPILIVWIFAKGYVRFYDECEEAQEIHNLHFNGRVIEKKDATPIFKSQYLKILTISDQEVIIYLSSDMNYNLQSGNSLIWELTDVGDSIVKESNSYIVKIQEARNEMADTSTRA